MMDTIQSGSITICGNFAPLLDAKPKDFDYMQTGKWLEDYSLEVRERIGSVVCNCRQLIVHYAPYYGFDMYHKESCNLMRQIKARPQLANLWQFESLPAVVCGSDSVPAGDPVPLWIDYRKHTQRIKVRVTKESGSLSLFSSQEVES